MKMNGKTNEDLIEKIKICKELIREGFYNGNMKYNDSEITEIIMISGYLENLSKRKKSNISNSEESDLKAMFSRLDKIVKNTNKNIRRIKP